MNSINNKINILTLNINSLQTNNKLRILLNMMQHHISPINIFALTETHTTPEIINTLHIPEHTILAHNNTHINPNNDNARSNKGGLMFIVNNTLFPSYVQDFPPYQSTQC